MSQLADEQIQIISQDPCPACDVKALTGYQLARQLDCQNCGKTIPLPKPIPRLTLADVQRPALEDVVYYLRFGDRVKIGTTRNLPQRMAALPHDELLATEPGGRDVERSRHMQFRASRVQGQREWFHLTDQIREHLHAVRHG